MRGLSQYIRCPSRKRGKPYRCQPTAVACGTQAALICEARELRQLPQPSERGGTVCQEQSLRTKSLWSSTPCQIPEHPSLPCPMHGPDTGFISWESKDRVVLSTQEWATCYRASFRNVNCCLPPLPQVEEESWLLTSPGLCSAQAICLGTERDHPK